MSTLQVNSSGYFPSSYAQIYQQSAENVLYCNADIYNKDKSTLFRKADAPLKIEANEVIITSITHDPVYVGDDSVVFDVETMVGENVTTSVVKYEWVDIAPPFETMGVYGVQVTATTTIGGFDSKLYYVTVYPDRNIDYPTDMPLPPEDGNKDVLIATSGNLKYCVTSDSISDLDAFSYASGRLMSKTNGICVNSTFYGYSDLNQCWEEIEPSAGKYYNRIYSYFSIDFKADLVYSTVDVYDSSSFETLIHAKNQPIPRQKYDYKTMQVATAIECTNPKAFDGSIEGYIIMRLTKNANTVSAFCFRGTNGNNILNLSLEPSASLAVMDNVEMCVLNWNVSSQSWFYNRKWGAVSLYGLGSSYGNFYHLIQEMENVNLYLHTKNREHSELLYETERVRQAIPLYFTVNGELKQTAGDSSSPVKIFDGEYWKGVELTNEETGVKVFINNEWRNIGLF